ncbi:hypothetical protein GUJ93_ZPchr0008g13015 [Zizania palustris]|uniref:CASP-like protein n=1 Tax=Zizania palustris TaxID=103762 RepID=A0A8J5RU46_ZIZPA|nr:hypothetical protein GUJ93_ZPchr0008g13015 [Zizania palustris]
MRRIVTAVLRLAAAAAAAVAAVVMATSHQTIFLFGMEVQANFRFTPSLVFFVAGNAAVSVCTMVLLLVPAAAPSLAARLVLMVDVVGVKLKPTETELLLARSYVLGVVLTATAASAGAISDLGKNGNSHAGWMPICEHVPAFCDRVKAALVAGFVAVLLYFLLLMNSILFPSVSMGI